jgi:hypothetical protein
MRTFIFVLTCVLATIGSLVQAQSPVQLTSSGVGAAQIGMTASAAEQALGRKLLRRKQASRGNCVVDASVQGLPGVTLVFERDRLIGVDVNQPTVTTPAGFKVG